MKLKNKLKRLGLIKILEQIAQDPETAYGLDHEQYVDLCDHLIEELGSFNETTTYFKESIEEASEILKDHGYEYDFENLTWKHRGKDEK